MNHSYKLRIIKGTNRTKPWIVHYGSIVLFTAASHTEAVGYVDRFTRNYT